MIQAAAFSRRLSKWCDACLLRTRTCIAAAELCVALMRLHHRHAVLDSRVGCASHRPRWRVSVSFRAHPVGNGCVL